MELTVGEIATRLDGRVVGETSATIRGVADARVAVEGQITFAEKPDYLAAALGSGASAVVVAEDVTGDGKPLIQVANVRVAMSKLLEWFHPEPKPATGIHPNAVVDPSASISDSASIGPGVTIGANVAVGERVILLPGVQVGADCEVGNDSKLFPNVVVYPRTRIGCRVRIQAGSVVGSDGYGYVFDGSCHRKIAQIGGVVLEDDVELGANVTIDRGAYGDTVIGEGSKLDNLVQIAHNVVIGKHCIIISQTGIAGSTQIGDFTIIAGQVGIAGHLKIGSQVTIAAQSGVMRDIPDGQKVFGSPAQGDRDYKRQLIGLQQLPDLLKRFKQWERTQAPD